MPERTEIFNLADCAVEIRTEDVNGAPDTLLTDYLIYVNNATLDDRPTVRKSVQSGKRGDRLTTIGHDYTLSLSRFHAKYSEDFGIASVSPDATYQIKLVYTNTENPTLTETHTLNGCQLAGRAIRTNLLENTVPLSWAVGDYVPPT